MSTPAALPNASADLPQSEERERNRSRFELELEFVQALANPFYLHSLAHQGFLNQPAFVNYLSYLQYWKKKDYARFILCVHLLSWCHHIPLYTERQCPGIRTLCITWTYYKTNNSVRK
jgi:hypothetical protein